MSTTDAVAIAPLPWFCCHTSDVATAHAQLTAQSFQVFWPRYWALDKAGQPIPRSLFGPYLFVALDLSTPHWRKVPNTRGIRRLISLHAERPLQVPTIALTPFIERYGCTGLLPYIPPVVPLRDKPQWKKLWQVAEGVAYA